MLIFFKKFNIINEKINKITKKVNKNSEEITKISNKIDEKINTLSQKMESKHIAEYVELMQNTKKLIWKSFISGIAKGIGIAIGFSILGAIAIYVLRQIVMLNLPVIGAFIKDIMNIVEQME